MVTVRRRRRRRCSTSTRRAPTSSPSLLPIFRAHVLTCELISRMQWWLFPCEWNVGNRRKLSFLKIGQVLVDLSLKCKVKTGPNEKHLWSITTGMIPKLCFTCFNFYSSLFSHTRSGILTSKLIMPLSFLCLSISNLQQELVVVVKKRHNTSGALCAGNCVNWMKLQRKENKQVPREITPLPMKIVTWVGLGVLTMTIVTNKQGFNVFLPPIIIY